MFKWIEILLAKNKGSMGQTIFLRLTPINAVLGIPLAWGSDCHLATKDVSIILADRKEWVQDTTWVPIWGIFIWNYSLS